MNGALSAVTSLRDSSQAADREAFSFLREGEVGSAISTLERFGEELARRGDTQQASDAYSRAARIAQYLDRTRALRDARRALELSPHSRAALDAVASAIISTEGIDAGVAFLERVIEHESEPTDFRAFAHALLAAFALGSGRGDVGQRHLVLARAEVAAFPRDAFLQAFVVGDSAIAAFVTGDLGAAQRLSEEAVRRFSHMSGEEWRFQNWPVLVRETAGDWDGAWNAGWALIAERERLGVQPSPSVLGAVCNTGLGLGRVAEAAPFCRAAGSSETNGASGLFFLADLAGSEGRIADGRRYVQQVIASPDFGNDRITVIYFDMAFAAHAGDFAEAESKLTIARGLLDSDIDEVRVRAQQLAYFTRWLGLREVEAHRLAQACPLLAEAERNYRAYGSPRGADAVRSEMRRARCPR